MAISATFELRENGGSSLYAALFKSYTVVDLDYTLKRSFDKTGRPSSGVSIDFIKVSIRGTKEVNASFHDWINGNDKMMAGIIKIYDSTGYFTAMTQDATGSYVFDSIGEGNDLLKEEAEERSKENLDPALKEGLGYKEAEVPVSDDFYDEMDRSELLSYIASKNLNIETSSSDSADTIREKIRYYNKIHNMSLKELESEAAQKNVTISGTTKTKEDYLRELEKYNNTNTKSSNSSSSTSLTPEEKVGNKAIERIGTGTKDTVISAVNTVTKGVLESARSITFKNAYCVSLREHFHGDPDDKAKFDASYPWILEIGIKPGTVEVTGWNVAGGAANSPVANAAKVSFEFFKV